MVTERVASPRAAAVGVRLTSSVRGSGAAGGPLLIAVTDSAEERVRLAELVEEVAPLLLVADFDELRRLIAPRRSDEPPLPPSSGPATSASLPGERPALGEPAPAQSVTDKSVTEESVSEKSALEESVLTIDSARSRARWQGSEVALTGLERELLTRLNTEPHRIWTYQALHEAVWRNRHLRGTADVHSLVKRLRRKLGKLGTTVTIDAVRGTGFRLTDHQRPSVTGLSGRSDDTDTIAIPPLG